MTSVVDSRCAHPISPTGTFITVTGGSGYIGSHVVAALEASGATVRTVGRSELRDPVSTTRAMAGASAVVHCVSAVSGTPEDLRRSNVEVAATVARAAQAAGVERLIAVSTASVTGRGPHRGAAAPPTNPASAVSASRAEGEEVLLGAGAIIIRPNLVWGAGDRWVVPTLASSFVGQGTARSWRARVSAVNVRDLASGISRLASTPSEALGTQRVLHADAPGPFLVAEIGQWISDRLLPRVRPLTATTLTPHQQSMLEIDNWFDSAQFWELAGVRPGLPFSPSVADLEWYADYLSVSTN
ncbi:NAD(P)-dependent oxidoreductase [Curtobacterium sp. MCBA15_012]|uniref:NAD-dependent epimerase/dehydratase family protein n=1 Tax=Curtobacterium sp. MCBA15_012 TaxID=1898738 RepID=UPI0008DE3B66|nr:NAD-dependent epimerase/dehydratase family protein [Curtobacterium sp. MCBA15_012]WIB00389.1 NAD-dependent epimerase/dehydratase family protein [Curtobacterium sp. MCBA15_012]